MRLFSNGLRGWRQSWKGDLRASISVAFIAIPLGLGIGLASGVPPLAAVIPCVVGGLTISWISGGNIAVHSTPKMLIGVTAAAVLTLGGEDVFQGYRFFLAAVVIAGFIQFFLGLFRLGVLGDLIPATVIKSLLASVGVIITVKQIPIILGTTTGTQDIVSQLIEVPMLISDANPIVVAVGLVSLGIMFVHPMIELPVIKAIPGAVWVIILSVAYSYALDFSTGGSLSLMGRSFSYGPSLLIDLPANITNSITFPDFTLWNNTTFWSIVVAVVIISSIEGILSAKAIDRLDPLRRKSNVNKELTAMGLGTSLSGLVGGLPVIPAIVATSVGVNHNARGQLLDVFQAGMMLILILLLGSQLQQIPLAALAGILIHTGYKLVNPQEIRNIYRIGWDQILVFGTTLMVTLTSDLIIGIAVGTGLTLGLHVIRLRSVSKLFTILFRPNVVSYEEDTENTFLVSVKGYSNFLNYSRLKKALDVIPADATIHVDLSLTEFIDHTVMEHLAEYEENHIRRGGNFEIIGLDTHLTSAVHPLSVRFRGGNRPNRKKANSPTLTSRQQKLLQLTKELEWGFDPSVRYYLSDLDTFHLFRFKTIDREYNKLIGAIGTCSITVKDVDYHEGEFQTKVQYHTTVAVLRFNRKIPLFTIEKEHLFDKLAAMAGHDDIDFKDFRRFSKNFRLKGENETEIRDLFSSSVLRFMETELPYRLESSGSSILVLGKDRLMSEAEIRVLAAFCGKLTTVLELV